MKDIVEAVSAHLFAEPGRKVFAVLDGASVPELRNRLFDLRPEHECLYRGDLKPDMAEVAPYLVHLEPKREFTDWVIREGWGKHWGVFALTASGLLELRQHFRRFLIVHDADGKPKLFRYYDPRVLCVYLPTCNAGELSAIFGPVASYLLEGEKPGTVLTFQAPGGALRQDEKQLEL